MRALSLLFLFIFLTSCSSSKSGQMSEFKVTVKSAGKIVDPDSDNLIHRVLIKKSELEELFGDNLEDAKCLKQLKLKKNFQGNVIGLQVKKDGISKLGLYSKDVIVTLGTHTTLDTEDFWHLKDLIEIEKQADLTIYRNGKANKVLYALDE